MTDQPKTAEEWEAEVTGLMQRHIDSFKAWYVPYMNDLENLADRLDKAPISTESKNAIARKMLAMADEINELASE